VSEQQQALDILQQLVNSFSNNVVSYPLLGVVLFVGLLWFFHEFREWRLSVSVLSSFGMTLLIMLALNPTFSPLPHILGF
jgi:Na+-translocating ferredoxin:NAD+ oxidoreductase RnfD subunit